MQQQRQSLDRFAQPHVVRQAATHAPGRQPRQPAKSVELIVPQLGLQCRGDFGFHIAGVVHPADPILPVVVGGQLDRLAEVFQRRRSNARKPQIVLLRTPVAVDSQFFDPRAQLIGQRHEPAVVQSDEAGGARLDQFDQLHHVHRQRLVHVQLSRHGEPVAVLANPHLELRCRHPTRQIQTAALRPIQHDLAGRNLVFQFDECF